METGRQPDAMDTRLIYRAYAIGMAATGLALVGWGPLWIDFEISGQPFGSASVIRMAGAILIAFGCFAVPLTDLDPPSRRRSLLWLTAGHTVVLVVLITQRAIWGPGPAHWLAALLNVLVWLGLYLWSTAEGAVTARPFLSLFGKAARSPTERLRSQYEQQIREAAGQEERNRLARDLHDTIKQQIFAMQTAAATAQVRFDDDPTGAKTALDQVRSSAREAMTEMEVMLDQLRAEPLENVGLIEALKKQCEALEFRSGARVRVEIGSLPPSETLGPGSQQAIFRVAQESLANIGRHARATNVAVRLRAAAGQAELKIQDDGGGFDTNQGRRGMGISNMRARAEELGGTLELVSRPGGGTCVTLSIPYVVAKSRDHAMRALPWALLLLYFSWYMARRHWTVPEDYLPLVFMTISAIALVRESIAYLRVRKLERKSDARDLSSAR